MKDIKDMIYLIQPWWYNKKLARTLKKLLKDQYPSQKLKIQRQYNRRPNIQTINTYFIINDEHLKFWNALKISQIIRHHEPLAHINLVTNNLDYEKFFKSHVGFLSVIDLKKLAKEEIKDLLDYTLKTANQDITEKS